MLLFFPVFLISQSKDPEKILKDVRDAFSKIEDYKVDVKIKVDVEFIKVPESKARIYFKQPDKTHIESEGFAMLPKEGINFSPVGMLKNKYTAIYDKEEVVDGINASVIKIIPLDDHSEVILSTFWVDLKKNVVVKVESTTKMNGTFIIDLKYDKTIKGINLPSSMVFAFNVDKMNIPKTWSGDLNSKKEEKKDSKPTTTGKVYITYSNYEINQGIPDSIFEKKEK
jgi:outer membrane lipoprotein-sorting protein